MAASPTRFFAPTFFTPYYFPSLVAAGGVAGDLYRDRDAFASIAASLSGTGEFADVLFGTTPGRSAAGADRTPVAVITPDAWSEDDGVDPVLLTRHVAFTLTLVVRAADPQARFDALDRLSSVAQNAVGGADLAGKCLPALTGLRRGRFDTTSVPPEQAVILRGEFTYLVPSPAGHSTAI